MPRLSNSFPSYRLHKVSGKAIVTLSGRDFYLGEYGSDDSRAAYDRRIAEWLANGRRLVPEEVSKPAPYFVTELVLGYLRFAHTYYRKDGKLTGSIERIAVAAKLLTQMYGRTLAGDFGPLKLRAVQQHLIEADKSRRYVNHVTEQIKRFFKWGVSMETIPASVFQALATVPGLRKGRCAAKEPEPVVPVADETVQATLPRLPEVVADMVRFQRLTGCRPGEVCIIRPCDVNTSGPVWNYIPFTHKTEHHGRTRAIFIGPKAQAVLARYLLRPAEEYCFSPAATVTRLHQQRHVARKTPLSCGNIPGSNRKRLPRRKAGSSYTTSSYLRAVVRACEVAFGMPKNLRNVSARLPDSEREHLLKLARDWRAKNCWSPNQLRHTAGTEIRAAYGAEAAQVVLGHAHLNVTEVYAERDQKKAAAIMAQLG